MLHGIREVMKEKDEFFCDVRAKFDKTLVGGKNQK